MYVSIYVTDNSVSVLILIPDHGFAYIYLHMCVCVCMYACCNMKPEIVPDA